MQDLIVAALDHSVPRVHFARGPLPIDEAVAQCNAPGNLRAAHATCNSAKCDKTRAEWFELGLDKLVGKPRLLTDGELLALQFRLCEGGRIAGRITGRRNKENGTGICAPGMAEKGGRIGGRITVAKKTGIHAQGYLQKGIGGRICAAIPGHTAKAGRGAVHKYHISNRIFNPKCSLCVAVRNEPWTRNARPHSGRCVEPGCTNKTYGYRQQCRACTACRRRYEVRRNPPA
jgi:hypothetical protein